MSDRGQESSSGPPHRQPPDDPAGAWLSAAIATAIMVGVIVLGGPLSQGSDEAWDTRHVAVLNTPDLVGHPPR